MGAFEGHWVTGEDKMGDLCQGLVSSHSSLSPPAHILFMGMLRLQENLKFDNYNTVAAAKLSEVKRT